MITPVRSVLVVGSGLIGGSVGLACRQLGLTVWLEDVDSAALAVAARRGAGALGPPEHDPDLVIVAVPPSVAAVAASTQLRRFLSATVSDVGSTKTQLQQEIDSMGVDSSRFVAGHPLAGREVSGPGAARADLFADRVWALTPTSATDPQRVRAVADVVTRLGAVPVITTAEAHDRAVALTSHTPQVVASLVAAGLSALGDTEVRLSGQGLRDVTRLAASDPDLWTQILTSNAVPVAEALEGLMGRLAELRHGLLAGEPDLVRAALVSGVAGHRKVPGKHGSAAVTYAVVPVVVADRPGELGRLFADAGATGVNLEDVRIEHAAGRPTGLVELEVRPESAPDLSDGLRAAGWDVRA